MKLFLTILLFIPFAVLAQLHGGTEYTINSSYRVVVFAPHFSVTGKKIPVLISMGGNGEYGTNQSTYFAVSFGRRYSTDSAYIRNNYDSLYTVLILPTTLGDVGALDQPNRMAPIFDFIQSTFPSADSTNYNLAGISQGAINALDIPCWPSPEDGGALSSFGLNTDYRWKRIKRVIMGSPCSPRSGIVFNKLVGRAVYFIHATDDGTCAVGFTNSDASSLTAAGAIVTKNIMPTGGHSNTVWDSLATVRGTDSTYNMFLRILGAPTVPQVYTQARVYDILDGSYGATDMNSPWNFFDNQKGGKSNIDPKNNVTTDTTTTGNPAKGFLLNKGGPRNDLDIYGLAKTNRGVPYYYRDGFSRAFITLDVTGLKNMLDTSLKFVLQEIWFKDVSDLSGLKMRLYNYDQEVLRKPIANRWAYDARPDSLCNQLDSLTTTGTGSWVQKIIDSTGQRNRMRYLRIMLTSDAGHHVSQANEIVLYGYYTADTTLYRDSVRPAMYTGPITNRKDSMGMYRKKIMTNVAQIYGLNTMAHDGGFRNFPTVQYYDQTNAPGIPATLNFWLSSAADFTIPKVRGFIAAKKDMILTCKGANPYTGGLVNTDAPGLDPENPTVWTRDSALHSDMTKAFGRNSAGTSRFTGIANGLNLFNYDELDNEPFDNGHTYSSILWKSRADWRAIKAVDTSMKVVQPGMVEASDTQQIKTIYFKSQVLTADKIFPFDILNGHKYFAEQDSLHGIKHTLTEMVGSQSQPATWAINSTTGFDKWADTLIRRVWKYLPGIQFWLTETGRDGFGTAPTTDIQASITSQFTTPSIAGLGDSMQVKAVWDGVGNIFAWASPLDRYINYEMTSVNSNPATQPRDQFYSSGKGANKSNVDPFDIQTFFPAWYFTASLFDRLSDYICDTILERGGRNGRWIFKGHKFGNTDSTVQVVFFGSKSAQSSTQSIPVTAAGSVEEVLPSFTTVTGTSTTLTPSAGVVSRTVTEKPAMYFYSTLPSGPIYNDKLNWKRRIYP